MNNITNECVERIRHLKATNEKYKYLRVEVDSGGCSGFQYNFRMCDDIHDNDIKLEKDGEIVVLDQITLNMIKGSSINYKNEMIRSGFEVVNNPNAATKCSCGSSFAPKLENIV